MVFVVITVNFLIISSFIFFRHKNLGDVKKNPYIEGDKIVLKMIDGFYNGNSITSIIEFICSNTKNVSKYLKKKCM